jgi:hypothetical protein
MIYNMDKEKKLMWMARIIRDSFKMEKNKDKVIMNGQTVQDIMAIG